MQTLLPPIRPASRCQARTSIFAAKNKDVLTWQLYDAHGQPQGSPGSEASPGSGASGVVLRDGKFVLFP